MVINHGTVVFDDTTEIFKKQFIKTKTVELVTDQKIADFKFPHGKILDQGTFNIKIELDTTSGSIDNLLSYAVQNFEIKDITITDPSMEDIIADIYTAKKV
jgi:ABC-2 type transport system ATP-binding protein